MSWNLLKRVPTIHHRPEFDPMTQSANETLGRLIVEFDGAENIVKSLSQAVKKLPDHILCMGKFETKLTDELTSSNLFTFDDNMRNILEEWHSLAFTTNNIGDEYVISVQKTLIEPLKQMRQAFAKLRVAIRLHDSIQMDVAKFQRKVSSYNDKEKTAANLVKLQEAKQALSACQQEYIRRTQELINDLGKFLAGSVEMLRPLLEGFIAAEVAWIRACKCSLDTRSHLISEVDRRSQSDRLKDMEDSFRSLSALSICSDSK